MTCEIKLVCHIIYFFLPAGINIERKAIVQLAKILPIVPRAIAWAPSEKLEYTQMLLDMLKNEQNLINSCEFGAIALFKCFEAVGISNQLCVWHSKHLNKAIAPNSHEYAKIKHKICTEFSKLKAYLDKCDLWNKISRFEGSSLRDQNLSTSSVESLNALIRKTGLKKKNLLMFFYIYMNLALLH